MKATGKFLVILRNNRKKHSMERIKALMKPLLRTRKMRAIIKKARNDRELAFIQQYNEQ